MELPLSLELRRFSLSVSSVSGAKAPYDLSVVFSGIGGTGADLNAFFSSLVSLFSSRAFLMLRRVLFL